MIKILLIGVIGYFIYTNLFGINSGCEKYASEYSCDYMLYDASYDVYYWRNVTEGNREDEKYITSVTGLLSCYSAAVDYARSINEQWNNRSYICILKKNGNDEGRFRY